MTITSTSIQDLAPVANVHVLIGHTTHCNIEMQDSVTVLCTDK